MTAASTIRAACPVCEARTAPHCPADRCGWWRCTRCYSFGDHQRTNVDARRRYGSDADQ